MAAVSVLSQGLLMLQCWPAPPLDTVMGPMTQATPLLKGTFLSPLGWKQPRSVVAAPRKLPPDRCSHALSLEKSFSRPPLAKSLAAAASRRPSDWTTRYRAAGNPAPPASRKPVKLFTAHLTLVSPALAGAVVKARPSSPKRDNIRPSARSSVFPSFGPAIRRKFCCRLHHPDPTDFVLSIISR